MRIALDFDGVLSHTMKRWIEVHQNGGGKMTLRDVDVWAFYEKFGMSKDECFAIFDQVWGNWDEIIPMEHDLNQKTKMLNNIGMVDIVTTVRKEFIPHITKWLEKEGVVYNKVIHSTAKHTLDYDVYIDDATKNAEQMLDAGKLVLLYNQPWNHQYNPDNKKCVRVYNLYHAIDVLRNG